MKKLILLLLFIPLVSFGQLTYEVDWKKEAKIREEGFLQEKKQIFVHKRYFVKFRCIYLPPLGPVSFNLRCY